MDFSQFGTQNQSQTYYQYQEPPKSKKKLFLIIGGVAALFITLLVVIFSGGSSGGQVEMKQSLQAMSDAVGIMDEYENKLQVSNSQNDVALIRIITRGNFHKLNDLYADSYNTKKFSTNPKPSAQSKEELDKATRDNTLDSEIIKVLEPKITAAEKYLKLAKPNFNKPDSLSSINKSINDFESIGNILNQAR